MTELAPAALAPVADAARAAIATINTQLTEMDRVEAGLQALETKYAKVVYAVDTDKGMGDAKAARRELKDTRVAVEHARVAAKRPVLDLGNNIDGKATTIKTRIQQLETPIDQQITVQETKEANRKADLERRIAEVRGTAAQCIGKTSEQLQEVLDGLNSLPLDTFQEYREQAAKAQLDATAAVDTLLTQAKQAEELARIQAQQRREQARKDAIQQAIDGIGASLKQLPMCRTSVRVQALLDNVEAIEVVAAVYQEFAAAAREKKAEVIAELVRVRDEKKTAEDARAAAAAAPAPTPAPTLAPTAAPSVFHDHELVDTSSHWFAAADDAERTRPQPDPVRSHHEQVNDEGAARLHRQFGSLGAPGHSLAGDFRRVMADDPFSADAPLQRPTEPSTSTQRPADAEILAVVADHYEVDAATAAGWLRTFDAASALAQQPLIPTT